MGIDGRNALDYLSANQAGKSDLHITEAIQMLKNPTITEFSMLKDGEFEDEKFNFVEEEEKLRQMHPQEFSSALPGISGVSIHDDNSNTKDKRNALHVLCQSNSSPNLTIEIKRLIELGYKVNDKDKDGRNALHYLCQDNSSSNLVEAIKLFIDTGIDAKAKDNDEWNALHYLCRFNSSSDLRDAIQILIKHGIDANEKTNDGCNTLHLLCQNHSTSNFIDAIQILIQQGIDVKEKDKNGRNALFFLIRNSSMDKHLKANVFRFLIRHGIQVHSENEESFNLYQDFFKENDNCGKICFDFLVKEEIRLGWHDKCENCQQILSITESPRVRLQHHQMFSSCYGVFHLLMKHLEKWAKSNQRPGESELDMSKPTKWLREKAEQYRETETGKSFKEDFEVMADVSEQVKKGSNSSEFNCDHYERYLRSMYSIAEMTDAKESMGQNKWFYLLPFDFPIDYGDEKEPDIKRAKIEWDRTLFSWAHTETDEYYGKYLKEDANEGFFLPKEFKHKCHGEL
uniref:Putative Ankyrin n=1 Tax=Daphnia magna TaxID=35525 RepID=A0A0P6F8Z7_9CRUS